MIQRISDYLHELKIRRLGRLYRRALLANDNKKATRYWIEEGIAINERSWAQVRRMERRMGLQ